MTNRAIIKLLAPFALYAGLTTAVLAQGTTAEADSFFKQVQALNWQFAPQVSRIGTEASISLSNDVAFLDAANTNRFVQLNGNLPCESCYALAAKSLKWFAVFSFDPSGYVRDDEKIDPDALLNTLKEQNKADLEERKKRGLASLILDGWYMPPHYDVKAKRLEWGTKVHSENGDITVNYTTRLLGRNGVMSVVLVSNPASLDDDLRSFKQALNGFGFDAGNSYTEFREGDKVAEYGLTALIVGGAAAAAAKSGLGKGLFAMGAGMIKVIGVAALALFAGIINYVRGLFRKKA